jgi:23S rRNA (pseudouridine1915-N3)-methyltransferase
MRLAVLAVGRVKDGPERELIARYVDRSRASGRSLGFSGPDIVEIQESRATRAEDRKAEEARAISEKLAGARLVILDERAKSPTSAEFADLLRGRRDAGDRALCFVTGGADGLDPVFAARADFALSFGAMTLPHQIVRLLIVEQLYRAMSILAGHPYHRA